MSLITWSPALSVGVKRFDDQHLMLVNMVNDLHAAMEAGQGRKAIGPILERLFAYTRTHFAEEEALLERHAYPGLTTQSEQHRYALERVAAFEQKHREGTVLLSVELMNFLREWLLAHIQGEDARYGPFLNARGVR